MRPQPHGGALRTGNPGHGGGPGRPPSALRALARESFADRVRTLELIADGYAPRRDPETGASTLMPAEVKDQLRALDMLAKYGLGEARGIDVETVRRALKQTVHVIAVTLGSESKEYKELAPKLREIWNSVQP